MTLTISLFTILRSTLAYLTLLLEVQVPALFLALVVLQGESDDGLGLVDSVFALSSIALESGVDRVESSGGGESV